MSASAPFLEAVSVTVHHVGAGRPALDQVSFEARRGEIISLLGPNGSGKSTLLRVLAGIQRPTSGEARVQGVKATKRARDEAARVTAFVPQSASVAFDWTVLEVALQGRHPFGRGLLLERREDVKRAEAALVRAGAFELRDRSFLTLSGGERQRAIVARAIVQDAPAILLDEPTSAQDMVHALSLYELFRELAKKEDRAVVVATHDVNAAARYSDQVIVLERGRVAARGAPEKVLVAELLRSVFEVEPLIGTTPEGVPYFVPVSPLARREAKA